MFAPFTQVKPRTNTSAAVVFGPVLIVPMLAYIAFQHSPGWQLMWSLAISIYASWKWQTFVAASPGQMESVGKELGYLFLWPGMNAEDFFDPTLRASRPKPLEWLFALGKLATGLMLLFVVVPQSTNLPPLAVGWMGMVGLVFVLHFGIFHLLSLAWRHIGTKAVPIMNFPILATSLSDFWGRRWNSAFRDLAFSHLFRPVARQVGSGPATLVIFLASGLIHELVISVPVRGGWGGPTFYFVVQGLGLLLERSQLGKRWRLGSGLIGRLFCGVCIVGPIVLLFHEPFVMYAILPTLAAFGIARI